LFPIRKMINHGRSRLKCGREPRYWGGLC